MRLSFLADRFIYKANNHTLVETTLNKTKQIFPGKGNSVMLCFKFVSRPKNTSLGVLRMYDTIAVYMVLRTFS